MALTRAFKSGNSQAVRVPAELASADMTLDLQITRLGDVLTVFPKRPGLAQAVALLRTLPKPPEAEARELIDARAGVALGVPDRHEHCDPCPRRHRCVLEQIARHEGAVLLSALSLAELQRGAFKASSHGPLRQARLDILLRHIPILPFDAAAAHAYGRIIATCVWIRGRDYDRMIAAHAIVTGSILVTNNMADFRDTPELALEDWLMSSEPHRLRAGRDTRQGPDARFARCAGTRRRSSPPIERCTAANHP